MLVVTSLAAAQDATVEAPTAEVTLEQSEPVAVDGATEEATEAAAVEGDHSEKPPLKEPRGRRERNTRRVGIADAAARGGRRSSGGWVDHAAQREQAAVSYQQP